MSLKAPPKNVEHWRVAGTVDHRDHCQHSAGGQDGLGTVQRQIWPKVGTESVQHPAEHDQRHVHAQRAQNVHVVEGGHCGGLGCNSNYESREL